MWEGDDPTRHLLEGSALLFSVFIYLFIDFVG